MDIQDLLSILLVAGTSALAAALLYWLQSAIDAYQSGVDTQWIEQLRESNRLAAQRNAEAMKSSSVQNLPWLFGMELSANQEGVSGSTGSRVARKERSSAKLVRPLRTSAVILGLTAIAFLLAGCALGTPATSTPIPTGEPLETASIQGTLWHDVCLNDNTAASPPAGCVVDPSSGSYIADGVRESGEPGLADVSIAIGFGQCPSTGLAEVMTDASGNYAIDGLWPGEYCVSVLFGGHQPALQVPGIWTTPGDGMQTVDLAPGEHRSGLDFGWDYLDQPATPTPVPTPTVTPTPRCVDSAEFIKDVTIPDGSRIDPGDSFTKTWRLRNSGNCSWTADYDLVYYGGDRMAGAYVIPLPGEVTPGATVDLSVGLVAPKSLGTYQGFWMLRNADDGLFGIGADAFTPFWVKILIDPKITDWRAEYFDNRKLDGDPVLIRNDKEIDFNWGSGAPASSLPAENFSARWTRELKFDAATYRFSVRVDDGARLWVDGRMVIDEWDEGSDRTVSVDLAMSKGRHDLRVEFFERSGSARVYLDIDKISVSSDGFWLAKYWFNRRLDSQWALISTVDQIDFDWGSGSPAVGIPDDDFSARWTRTVDFEPGIYRLYARADDGIRVRIDGERVINEWDDSDGRPTYSADVELDGSHQLQVDYFEHHGKAKIAFWWEYLGPVNHTPQAVDDQASGEQDQPLEIDVLHNDLGLGDGPLTVSIVNGPANGSIEIIENRVVYTPAAGFVGEDVLQYVVTDIDGEQSQANVTILIVVSGLG